MVLTSSMCRIQGWGQASVDGSSGSLVLSRGSSSAASFQTTSLLSLPCLFARIYSQHSVYFPTDAEQASTPTQQPAASTHAHDLRD
jgi:hypothetical protein